MRLLTFYHNIGKIITGASRLGTGNRERGNEEKDGSTIQS